MNKNLFTLFLTICIFSVKAQFAVTANNNANTLAQYLAGPGVTISNATLVCPTSTAGVSFSGLFTGADLSLGIPDGVLLSTGEVTDIEDAIGSTTFISEAGNAVGDSDLNNLLTDLGETYTTNDACVLEFDIVVIGDSLRFNYAMGSEEYPTFVCGNYNDIFGFFISGPNPAGGNYVDENIALIPGTNLPVSINTVNNGGSGGAITCYDGVYSNFMNSNTTPISAVPNIAFNEITSILTAEAATIPCQQYHFKLAIADGGDFGFDSGVFLDAGSFTSTGLLVSTSSILGEGFNTMVEGCIPASIDFSLEDGPNTTGIPYAIPLNYSGTATQGVDYAVLPDTVWIAPGDSTVTIVIPIPPNDGITEGTESIDVNVIYPCGSVNVATLEIADSIPVTITPSTTKDCYGDTITIVASGAEQFIWNSNPIADYISSTITDSVLIVPAQTSTIQVFYTLGSCVGNRDIPVFLSNLTANLNPTPISCPGFDDGSISVTNNNNTGTVNYLWNTTATTSTINNLSPMLYEVAVSDDFCTRNLVYDMENPSNVDVTISTGGINNNEMIETCVDAVITYTLNTGPNTTGVPFPIEVEFGGSATEGIDYNSLPDTVWIANGQTSTSINLTSISDGITEGTENIVALVIFSCGASPLDSIVLNDLAQLNILVSDSFICPGSFVSIDVIGNYDYQWEPAILFFDPTASSVFFFPDNTVDVTLTASIGTCDFTHIIPITVEDLAFDILLTDISCQGENDGSIVATPLNANGIVTYNWTNGGVTNSIDNLSTGIYTLNANDEDFCAFTDSFEIIETIPTMTLETDKAFICKNNTVNFEVTDNLDELASYSWKPNNSVVNDSSKNTSSISLEKTTTFTITGTNPTGCSISDSITIEVQGLEIVANYLDTTVGSGAITNIGVTIVDSFNIQNPISFNWSPTSFLASTDLQNTTTSPEDNVAYVIIAESDYCIDSAEITVFVAIDFEMPDAFTPNDDGLNDVFNPVLFGGEILEFRIYNRWGEIIHNDPKSGWDGKFEGEKQISELYNYFIKVSNGNEEISKFGTVTLLY